MRSVLNHIEHRAAEYAALPLYAFLRDAALDAEQRLAFVPGLAHFVMTFADLYAMVLREEPARDRFQEIVNAHTHEDGGHWRWYLADLAALGGDDRVSFTEALRFIWSPATANIRMLSYRIAHLGLGASSLQKLVLVECIETAGKISLESVADVGGEVARRLNRNLVYFGPHHLDTEKDHTLEVGDVRSWLLSIELDLASRVAMQAVVDQSFDAFTDFAHELLRFAQTPPTLGPPND